VAEIMDINRLKDWINGKKPGPYSLEFYTDVGCNLFCKFCNPGIKPVKHLNFDVAFKLLDEAKELDVKVIRIIGIGDPFMKRKEMMTLIKKIKGYKMFGYVVTNGTFFREEDIKDLVECKWDEIRISLHGYNQKIHDYLTGRKGTYDIVIKNLELFKKYKAQLNSTLPRIRINYVLNKKNYDSVEQMAGLCEKLGCDLVILPLETPNIESHKYLKSLVLSEEDKMKYEKIVSRTIKKFETSKIEILVPMRDDLPMIDKKLEEKENLVKQFRPIFYSNEVNDETNKKIKDTDDMKFLNSACFDPWLNVTIKDYDTFGVCCPSVSYASNSKGGSKTYGKCRTLKEIWYGEYYSGMRKKILNGEMEPFCSFCCNTDAAWISNELIKYDLCKEKELPEKRRWLKWLKLRI
jgi:MoaA/NifB/PqqE/SkfB family radical SAM enzyme